MRNGRGTRRDRGHATGLEAVEVDLPARTGQLKIGPAKCSSTHIQYSGWTDDHVKGCK